ncbi:Glutaminase [Bibersteinia trehalosi USDA-ARS-USMARC-189]|nr:glutaminase [Bibersteinia trehalosi]AHG84339.1 Glutaminase [Bibersteinia trehalosi USDA-ARS-USMARC-189]
MMNYQTIISTIYQRIRAEENGGELAMYIPELANISPDKFGVAYFDLKDSTIGVGDYQEKFSIQSIVKVLSLVFAYKHLGDSIWKRVNVEPSGTSFNSLLQLETDCGIPRNPFINAGAIVICDILLSLFENPKQAFLDFVRDLANNSNIHYSEKVAESEKAVGYRNFALCYYIKSFGNIQNDPNEVLDFYFHICSIEMSCEEIAYAFSFLANDGVKLHDNQQVLNKSQIKRTNALMQTCGFYDESGEFAFRVGLPGKSGVGGGIVAIMPNHHCITVWSPKLNEKGNSYRGMKFLEEFTTQTKISVF